MFGKHCAIWILVIGSCAGLMCCSSHALYEAQETVATADSLWHNGQSFSDSAQLAQAYRTLHRRRNMYPDEYAHACYHYGRLLRAKDDPVAAMQCFINASHSRTHDYHILGRIYSNMGSICHLADEYALSYDMYERSANVFLQDRDTLSYYYLLNDMAYELAEQGKEETLTIIDSIIHKCKDEIVIAKTWETKAEYYVRTAQYESAIECVNHLSSLGICEPTDILIKAQAFDDLGQKDSALKYSNIVLSEPYASYQDKFNALYIVLHCDSTLGASDISSLASQREDIRYYEYEPQKEKLSAAVTILRQDLTRRPDLRWLYVMIITIIVVSGAFYWRIKVRKRQMEKRVDRLIEHQADSITQSIKHHIDTNDIAHTLHWKNYASMKADADLYMGSIVTKLELRKLKETEIRFCILTMLDFSQSRIAEAIHYSYPSGIKTLKKRISVKLGTTPPKLRDFLFQIAMNI